MFRAPWMVIWPGLALSIVVYGINMFGDAVRDLLDPRLIGGVGRYGVKVNRKILRKGELKLQADMTALKVEQNDNPEAVGKKLLE